MNIEVFRELCLSMPLAEESFPFDEFTLVFKVMNKMFALLPLNDDPPRANLKADPERSIILREHHHQIIPGWHMNKKHWNTVYIEDGLEDDLIIDLVQHSYDLVVSKLPKKIRLELQDFQNNDD